MIEVDEVRELYFDLNGIFFWGGISHSLAIRPKGKVGYFLLGPVTKQREERIG